MLLLPIGDVNPRERVPVVNYALIALNVAVFLLFALSPAYERVVEAWGLVPASATAGERPWTFVTSLFLHGGIAHLMGNLLFLWITGDNVEDRFGHAGFAALYLSAGLAAGFAHIAMTPPPQAGVPCIGASGAIAGVLGAYAALFPRGRIRILFVAWFFYPIVRVFLVPAIVALGLWFLEQFLFDLMERSAGEAAMTGVAYWAHIGGFVLGFAVAWALRLLGIVRGGVRYRSGGWRDGDGA